MLLQLKYEEVHLKAHADGREARDGIGAWIAFCNARRPHQGLDDRTSMEVWRGEREPAADMPPRLDNARALPACPQRQQQQQPIFA
jgi:putative transposase